MRSAVDGSPALVDIIDGLRDLPSLPAVVGELLGAMDNPGVALDVLAHKIAHDQALAAKTLRLANSSFYGTRSRAATLRDAIAILGLRALRTVVVAAAVTSAFSRPRASTFDFEAFWRHCICTALCARPLARTLGLNEDIAFTVGLLHDVGRLVLVTRRTAEYEQLLKRRTTEDVDALRTERAVLGVDHVEAGVALARHWRFPASIVDAIAAHHAPEDAGALTLIHVVHVGDAMAHALALSRRGAGEVPTLSVPMWSRFELTDEAAASMFAEVDAQVQSVSEALAG